MATDQIRSMLDTIRGIRQACDLDLLVFFYRHPRALLTSEQLIKYLGYESEQTVKSLENLIDAGIVTQSQNRTQAARLYVLETGAVPGGVVPSLLKIATTRAGRQEVLRRLGAGATSRVPVARRLRSPYLIVRRARYA